MHVVKVLRGKRELEDRCGGVFVSSRRRGLHAPVYMYGPKDSKVLDPVFTCPVSAIPSAVWRLFDLWVSCHAMKSLPLPGGVLAQPGIVRRAFTIFEMEQEVADAARQAVSQAATVAAMLGAR